MARTALTFKQAKKKLQATKLKAEGKKVPYPTRIYNRCKLCGRNHGYMRRFDMCRICLRQLAVEGKIPGLKKSSW